MNRASFIKSLGFAIAGTMLGARIKPEQPFIAPGNWVAYIEAGEPGNGKSESLVYHNSWQYDEGPV